MVREKAKALNGIDYVTNNGRSKCSVVSRLLLLLYFWFSFGLGSAGSKNNRLGSGSVPVRRPGINS